MLSMLGKKYSRKHCKIFSLFFPSKIGLTFHANCLLICTKYQSLFSVKNKKKKSAICHLLNLLTMLKVKIKNVRRILFLKTNLSVESSIRKANSILTEWLPLEKAANIFNLKCYLSEMYPFMIERNELLTLSKTVEDNSFNYFYYFLEKN